MGFIRLLGLTSLGALLAALLGGAAPAADALLSGLDEADQAALELLAGYPREDRLDALEASTEADVLADLASRQERSRSAFAQLLGPYDRDTQEGLFDLSRYPELIAAIVEGGPKSAGELEAIASPYPEAVRERVISLGRDDWKVVARIDALLRDEGAAFEARIAELPEAKRAALRQLVALPELLALLGENMTLAVLLGDAYERRPEDAVALLDALNEELAQRGSQEAREFADAVEADPELAQEVADSTLEYEQETGYSAYEPVVVNRTVVQVNVRPFPYWVGCPWWYGTRYAHYDPWYHWYPRHRWVGGGLFFGPRIVAGFGRPLSPFWGWYFHRPIHHYHYPRLTHHVVRFHERHHPRRRHDAYGTHPRRYPRPGGHAVARFVHDSRRTMPRDFLRPDRRRVDRLREYGRRGARAEPASVRGREAARPPVRRERDAARPLRGERPRGHRLAPVERTHPARVAAQAKPAKSPKPGKLRQGSGQRGWQPGKEVAPAPDTRAKGPKLRHEGRRPKRDVTRERRRQAGVARGERSTKLQPSRHAESGRVARGDAPKREAKVAKTRAKKAARETKRQRGQSRGASRRGGG